MFLRPSQEIVQQTLDNFSYDKTKRCENIGVAPLSVNRAIVVRSTENACVLNNQFCSVFTKEDLKIPTLTLPFSPEIPEINIDIEGVR